MIIPTKIDYFTIVDIIEEEGTEQSRLGPAVLRFTNEVSLIVDEMDCRLHSIFSHSFILIRRKKWMWSRPLCSISYYGLTDGK